jgi:DNA-binding transcriptional MocR family regulator
MSKERIHICIEPHLKSQISELAEIVTGSPKNFSQTISALLTDYADVALDHARRVKAERQEAIRDAMGV